VSGKRHFLSGFCLIPVDTALLRLPSYGFIRPKNPSAIQPTHSISVFLSINPVPLKLQTGR